MESNLRLIRLIQGMNMPIGIKDISKCVTEWIMHNKYSCKSGRSALQSIHLCPEKEKIEFDEGFKAQTHPQSQESLFCI